MNAFQNMMAGYESGNALRNQREEKQRVNHFAQLAGQAYTAPPEQQNALVGQAIATDPSGGVALAGAVANDEERRNRTMVNMARMLTSAPEQARPKLYEQMLPRLGQYGLSELPPAYNEQTSATIMEAANAVATAYGGASQKPEDFTLAPGSARYDASGRVIANQPFSPTRPQNATFQVDKQGQGWWLAPGEAPVRADMPGNAPGPGTSGNPLPQGGVEPVIEAITASANEMISRGVPEAEVEAWAQQQLNPGGPSASGSPAGGSGIVFPNRDDAAPSFAPLTSEEIAQQGLPPGTVAQRNSTTGEIKIVYRPDKEEAKTDGLNDRQRVGVAGVQRNLLAYAAALTSLSQDQLSGMSATQIADEIKRRGQRKVQGGVARAMTRIPGGTLATEVANSDILSYSTGAGSAWAAYENPTGLITNTDRESATAQMPNPLDPVEVQADKIRNFLELSGWGESGPSNKGAPAGAEAGGWSIQRVD